MNIAKSNKYIPLELCKYIFQYINEIPDQINYCSVNKIINENIKITMFVDQYYCTKITESCLHQNMFNCLEHLDISNNPYIKNINHLKNLRSLVCRGKNSALRQRGIKNLKLEKLYCSENEYINDISHMKNTLKYLEPNDNIKLGVHRENICGFTKPCIMVMILITTLLLAMFCMILASVYYGSIKNDLYQENN